METNLRPLTLGEILDRTAQLYRSNFWLFVGIASVYSGAVLFLNLIWIGVEEFLRAQHLARYVVLAGGVGLMIQMFVSFVVGGIAVAANNRAVGWLNLGEAASIRGAYASILPRTGRYVWLMTIITFKMWWPVVLVYSGLIAALVFMIPGAPRGVAAATPPEQRALLLFGGMILLGFVFLLCLVYAIFVFLRYSLAVPASVMEGLKARAALRRSVALTTNSRGRIFLLVLLVIVIQIGLVGITQAFFLVLAFRHGELPVGARIAQQMVAFVTNTFLAPIYATGLTLFYYDQRVRKEGYDIERMMQAAGLTPTALDQPSLGSMEVAPAPDLPLPNHPDQARHA